MLVLAMDSVAAFNGRRHHQISRYICMVSLEKLCKLLSTLKVSYKQRWFTVWDTNPWMAGKVINLEPSCCEWKSQKVRPAEESRVQRCKKRLVHLVKQNPGRASQPGRTVEQEQEQISPNHVPSIFCSSVRLSNPNPPLIGITVFYNQFTAFFLLTAWLRGPQLGLGIRGENMSLFLLSPSVAPVWES